MEKEYFSKINWKRLNTINDKLKRIALNHNVRFINDFEAFCNIQTKRCDVITNGIKIHYDTRGHITIYQNLIYQLKFWKKLI